MGESEPHILLKSNHRLLFMFTLFWSYELTQMIPRILVKDRGLKCGKRSLGYLLRVLN